MNINPEFQRHCWLELTPQRLLAMPTILGAFFYLVGQIDAHALYMSGAGLFFFLVFLWGPRLSAEALIQEVKEHTWDNQRLSCLGPWTLTWGKLLGGTVFVWYGGLFCLAAIVGSGHYGLHLPGDFLWRVVFLLIAGGIFSQGFNLLMALLSVRKGTHGDRGERGIRYLSGFLILIFFLTAASELIFPEKYFHPPTLVTWFGETWPLARFFSASLLLFTIWTLLAIYRVMREELQIAGGPWVWLGFLLFIMVYFSGFIPKNPLDPGSMPYLTRQLILSWAIAMSATYLLAFSESKDPVIFRRLQRTAGRGEIRKFFQALPLWLTTLVVVLLLTAVITLLPITLKTLTGFLLHRPDVIFHFKWTILAMVLFLVRDLGILLVLNLGRFRNRADMAAILYFAVLYGLIPALIHDTGLEVMLPAFVPLPGADPAWIVCPPLLQATLVVSTLAQRLAGDQPGAT